MQTVNSSTKMNCVLSIKSLYSNLILVFVYVKKRKPVSAWVLSRYDGVILEVPEEITVWNDFGGVGVGMGVAEMREALLSKQELMKSRGLGKT